MEPASPVRKAMHSVDGVSFAKIAGMDDSPEAANQRGLPRHLAALVGAIQGPPDLGEHHDKYLMFPDPAAGSDGAETA